MPGFFTTSYLRNMYHEVRTSQYCQWDRAMPGGRCLGFEPIGCASRLTTTFLLPGTIGDVRALMIQVETQEGWVPDSSVPDIRLPPRSERSPVGKITPGWRNTDTFVRLVVSSLGALTTPHPTTLSLRNCALRWFKGRRAGGHTHTRLENNVYS